MVGMDPMIPTAVTMLANVVGTLRNASDLAKSSTDADLKIAISEAYSALIDLKAKISELDDENRELKAKLAQKENWKRHSKFGYYIRDEEPDAPICQKCYEGGGKIAYLSAVKQEPGGLRRECIQCNHGVYEVRYPQADTRVRGRRGWMGN